MPRFSIKKIFLVIFILFLLAHSGRMLHYLAEVCSWFYDSLEPLKRAPPEFRYFLSMLVFAVIIWILFKLVEKRK